jgi:hypothetical protein
MNQFDLEKNLINPNRPIRWIRKNRETYSPLVLIPGIVTPVSVPRVQVDLSESLVILDQLATPLRRI